MNTPWIYRVAALLIVISTVLLVLISGLIYSYVQQYSEGSGFSYTDQPFDVVPHDALAGQTVGVVVHRCYSAGDSLAYEVNKFLVHSESGVRITLPATQTAILRGCDVIVDQVQLPPDLPPGTYDIRGSTLIPWTIGIQQIPWQSKTFVIH